MALLTAAGNASAKTNYPLAAFPAGDVQNMYPLSVWHWTRQPDTTSTFNPFALNDSTNNGFDTYYVLNGSNQTFCAEQYTNPLDGNATAILSPAINTWLGWGGVYRSATSRTVVAPGGLTGTDVNGVTNSAVLSNLRIAMVGQPTHAMAEFAGWNAELGDAEFARLRAGANPATVRPERLLWYFPLRGDVRDYGPLKLQVTGAGTWDKATAAFTDHPLVSRTMHRRSVSMWRRRRRPIIAYG